MYKMWIIEWKSAVRLCVKETSYLVLVRVIYFILVFGRVNAEDMSEKNCGVVASDNPVHQHPWLVVLEYHYKGQTGGIRCAGTLIDNRHIVTSAHCVRLGMAPIIMLPRLGEYNMASNLDCVAGVCADPVQRMVIQRVFVHHSHGARRDGSNDLAILVLEAEAPYTDFIRPICLPSGALDEDTEFYASGFGATPFNDSYSEVKKNIPLPYFPNCRGIYKYIPPDLICAGGVKNFDTCRGDSGGPLVRMKKRAELWGVTKGGHTPCGLPGKPGLYTSVMYHLDWINQVIEMTPKESQNDENNLGQRHIGSFQFSLFCFLLIMFTN